MKKPNLRGLILALVAALLWEGSALAISNIPTWLYRQNDRCGPAELVPAACAAPAEKERYCAGFDALLSAVSSAGERIAWTETVVWCWTLIEEWHACEIPDPALCPRCREDARALPAPEAPCRLAGFEQARQLYLTDLDRRCRKAD